MHRRLLVILAAVLIAACSVTAFAVARGGDDNRRSESVQKDGPRTGKAIGHRGGPGHHGLGHHGLGPLGFAFRGFAEKLGVTRDQLRTALKGVKKRHLDRTVAAGTITAAERAALEACKNRTGTCDRDAARAAHRKLHAARKADKKDLAKLKGQLLGDLAAELGKPEAEIATAARAALSDALDKAVSVGFLTAKGRELSLGCFDTPASCDIAAVKAEVRFRGFGGRRGHGGRRHGARGAFS